MSKELQDQISHGEDLASAALKQVFGLSLDPGETAVSEESNNGPKPKTAVSTSFPSNPNPSVFKAEDHANDGKRHLLIACSGSVATIKLPNILRALSSYSSKLSIRIILTAYAAHFLCGQAEEQPHFQSLTDIPGVDGLHTDLDEWKPVWTRGAPILHIELRRWADALVVAPLSANTMAKMVGGQCDNLLTSIMRAWDTEGLVGFNAGGFWETDGQSPGRDNYETSNDELAKSRGKKMIYVAPAMNTAMWRHPLTAKQIQVLEDEWSWMRVLRPVEKSLACGDVGTGAMKEWTEIVKDIEVLLHLSRPSST